jgi:hypothetical protein
MTQYILLEEDGEKKEGSGARDTRRINTSITMTS